MRCAILFPYGSPNATPDRLLLVLSRNRLVLRKRIPYASTTRRRRGSDLLFLALSYNISLLLLSCMKISGKLCTLLSFFV